MRRLQFILVFISFSFGIHLSQAQPCTGITIADADCSPLTIVRLYYDNDLFAGTNRYYTQGIKAEVIHPRFMDLYLSSRFLLRVGRRARTYYGLGLSHQAFSPQNIEARDVALGDRPYAGSLVLSHFLISNDKDRLLRMTTSIDLGVIGPWSGSNLLNNSQNGWENQVRPDVVIGYNAKLEKGLFESEGVDAQLFGKASLSTLRPHVGAGGQVRVGLLNPYFYALHSAKRSLYGQRRIHDRQVYAIVNGGLDWVAYDATLQGGLINGGLFSNNAPYELTRQEIKRLMGYFSIGFNAEFRGIQLGYSHNVRARSFQAGERHSWGQIRLIVSF
jgi:hypothetical protein